MKFHGCPAAARSVLPWPVWQARASSSSSLPAGASTVALHGRPGATVHPLRHPVRKLSKLSIRNPIANTSFITIFLNSRINR